jgi:hypothetical protein
MIRTILLAMAAVAPLAVAQEAAKVVVAAAPTAMRMARQNLDAVAPIPVVVPLAPHPTFPAITLEFPLCATFPSGPSLIKDGDTLKIRMRPGDAPLPAGK